MTFAAAITGNLLFLIAIAAVGVINWWMEQRKNKASSDQQQRPSRPLQKPIQPSAGESEQERLRRFLEALGVPQQPGQTQPPPPSPARPPATPRPAAAPVPAPVQRRVSAPLPQRTLATPRPAAPVARPATVRHFPPEPDEMQRAGRLEEPAAFIEDVSEEFQRMTVAVAAKPIEPLEISTRMASADASAATIVHRRNAPLVETLRVLLLNRSDLRTTFVAMELLGAPRGLQS